MIIAGSTAANDLLRRRSTIDQIAPPSDHDALLRGIRLRFDDLSPTSRKIARFLAENPNDVAMMSVNAIGNACGVHASSFVRFAQAFGFSGFKELQGLFQRRLTAAADGASNAAMPANGSADAAAPADSVLHDVVRREVRMLTNLDASADPADIRRAARMLGRADMIFLHGAGRARAVREHLRAALARFGLRIAALDDDPANARRSSDAIGARDLLIVAIDEAESATDIVETAARRGAGVIAIGEAALSPTLGAAAVFLGAPDHEYGRANSPIAQIALVEALVAAYASITS